MSFDVLLRRAALGAIPVIALGLYLARSPRPRAAEPKPATGAIPSAPAADPGPAASDLAERGEAALAGKPTKANDEAPAVAAAELPLADSPTLPKMRAHHRSGRSERASSGATGACGGIEAKLITASDDPAWAFASLSPGLGEPAQIRRVGEPIGGWHVDRIEWDRVWLRSGGSRCAVGMHLGAREEMEAAADAGAPRRGAVLADVEDFDPKQPWRLPGEIANAIDKRGETEFVVERAMIKPIFERSGALLSGLSISPSRRGDDVIGLVLDDVRSDSLFERLGIEDGDVVLAIDDEPVKSLESVVKALVAVRENERLTARLERKGEAFELRLVAR